MRTRKLKYGSDFRADFDHTAIARSIDDIRLLLRHSGPKWAISLGSLSLRRARPGGFAHLGEIGSGSSEPLGAGIHRRKIGGRGGHAVDPLNFRALSLSTARMDERMDEPGPPPDLLEADPRYRIDRKATDRELVFAFAGSTSGGLFAAALDRATVARSSWEPTGYVADLFLERFVREQMALEPGQGQLAALGYLLRTISTPPSDAATIGLRRRILGDLTRAPQLGQCPPGRPPKAPPAAQSDRRHRRQARRRTAATRNPDRVPGTSSSTSKPSAEATSALSRLAQFAKRVREGEGFIALEGLLSYEEKAATLDFRVQLGADGRVRHLELTGVAESRQSAFWNRPLRRWLAKMELVLRGYRFGDGEVMARLLDAVFEGVRAEFPALVQMLGDVEFYLAALAFRNRAVQAGLEVCLPAFVPSQAPRVLEGLFNPLLLGAGRVPVPCRLETDRHDTTLLITRAEFGR